MDSKSRVSPAGFRALDWPIIGLRALAVTGLASLMGLAFNASNPLGVRWSTADPAEAPAVASLTNTSALPTALALEPLPVVAPPLNPTPNLAATVPTETPPPATQAAAGAVSAVPSQTSWTVVKPLAEQGKVVLVDARSEAAYEAGHIPGAILLPESSSDEEIRAFRDEVGVASHLVIYCSSTSCSLSFKLAYKLTKDYGFEHVQFMTGGYLEYQRSLGLAEPVAPMPAPQIASAPVVTSAPPAVPLAAPAAPSPAPVAASSAPVNAPLAPPAVADPPADPQRNPSPISWSRTAEWRQQHRAVLVDARPAADYIAGHVPGAISLPAESGAEQLAVFAAAHPPQVPLVVYGRSRGELRTFLFARQLLQQQGFENVRFTDDGYTEWLADQNPTPDPPTVTE